MSRRLAGIDRLLTHVSPPLLFGLALSSVMLVGVLDYAWGDETSLSLFYLAPVAAVAWYMDRRTTVAIAIFAALIWLLANMASGHFYNHPLSLLWELLTRFATFLAQGLLLSALRDALAKANQLARTDMLTGLSSRLAFEEQFQHDLRLARRDHLPITLAFLDLDDFKAINDTHGHLEGDRVLRVTGRVLRESIRGADTAARLGGDEFVVVLLNTDSHGAQKVITKIRADLHQNFIAEAAKVTFSTGAITFTDPPATLKEALTAADALMYQAKRRGKGLALFKVIGTRSPPVARAAEPARLRHRR